jgi:hypothetical protein
VTYTCGGTGRFGVAVAVAVKCEAPFDVGHESVADGADGSEPDGVVE